MFESIKNRNRDALRVYRRKNLMSGITPRQRKNIKKWLVKRNRRMTKNSSKLR